MYDYNVLPEHMRGPMERYIKQGIAPGGFLQCVLENDLVGSCVRADLINQTRLKDFAVFLHQEVPHSCWGSYEKVRQWMDKGGLQGLTGAKNLTVK